MAFEAHPNVRKGQVYYWTEATAGTGPTTEAVNLVRHTTFSLQVDGETDVVVKEAGRLWPTQVSKEGAAFTGTIRMPFVYGDNNALLAFAFREVAGMPTEITAFAPTVSFITAGAHLDGSTGQQLKVVAANGAFDAILPASSQALAGGLWLQIASAATAGNNFAARGPVFVKPGNPRDSGADTLCDLDARFFQAAAGWGSAWAAEDTLDALVIQVGAALVPNSAPASGAGTATLIVRFNDVGTAMYFALTGVVFHAPTPIVNGRNGILEWEIPFSAFDLVPYSDTVPTSGTFTDANTGTVAPTGGAGIKKIVIATDTQVVELQGCEITSFNSPITSNIPLLRESLGSTTVCGWLWGDWNGTISFDYRAKSAAASVAEKLQAIGDKATREKCSIYLEAVDLDGNKMTLLYPEMEPGFSVIGSVGGDADAPISGTFTATLHERPPAGAGNTWPGFVYQVLDDAVALVSP